MSEKQPTLFDILKETDETNYKKNNTTSIIPTSNIIPILNRTETVDRVKNKEQFFIDVNNTDFEDRKLNEGLFAYAKNYEDALLFAYTISSYKYSLENPYITDLCSAIYTMITTNQLDIFYNVKIIYTKDIKTEKKEITGMRVTLDLETIYLLTLGHILNKNGRAIDGAGSIAKTVKKALLPILEGKKDIPRQVTSLKNKETMDGMKIPDIVVQDYPMKIHRLKKIDNRQIVTIDLNAIFYPIKEDKGKYIVDSNYIHQVSGLTSFLAYGKKQYTETDEYKTQLDKYNKQLEKYNETKLASDKPKNKPLLIDYQTARKIILTTQTSYNLEYCLKGASSATKDGRINITLQTSMIKNLYPEAVSKDGKIRWTLFSQVVSLAGKYYRLAMEGTGITNDLIDDENVIIPAEKNACQFIKNKKIVYLKADKYIPKLDY